MRSTKIILSDSWPLITRDQIPRKSQVLKHPFVEGLFLIYVDSGLSPDYIYTRYELTQARERFAMQATMHAENSAEKFGGVMEDYLEIHVFLDSSKASINDARHRTLTHTSWFIREVLPRIFGQVITNSDGDKVSVVDIAELHVLEDFDMLFVPTPQDFLGEIKLKPWMDNARDGELPPSRKGFEEQGVVPPSIPTRTSWPSRFSRSRPCANAGEAVLD